MTNEIKLKILEKEDIPNILEVLKEPYMLERAEQYKTYWNRCYEQNISKDRVSFLAISGDQVAGYVHLLFQSYYQDFKDKKIPEINDLYVVPVHRKNGIGKRLLDTCEKYAKESGYQSIGLGVGLYKDYGSAQRLYTSNGYVLDGNGLIYGDKPVSPGTNAFVDDDLLLYLVKDIKAI